MSNTKNRASISKSVRFEVFKRDSFKCQYCGAAAPDFLLQIDHIKPVAKGGTSDITNLITSCAPCNSGKKDKQLDDKTAVAKSRLQMEELQERREQLEMMMQWREGLRDINEDVLDRVCSYWHDLAPGWNVSDHGKVNLRKWIRKFSVDEILSAMDTAAAQYLQLDRNGACTSDSWTLAFSKIPGICRVEREAKKDPDIREIYYVRGILRKKLSYFDEGRALQWLRAARSWDVKVDELREIALRVRNWTQFGDAIDEVIARQRKYFNAEDDSEG